MLFEMEFEDVKLSLKRQSSPIRGVKCITHVLSGRQVSPAKHRDG